MGGFLRCLYFHQERRLSIRSIRSSVIALEESSNASVLIKIFNKEKRGVQTVIIVNLSFIKILCSEGYSHLCKLRNDLVHYGLNLVHGKCSVVAGEREANSDTFRFTIIVNISYRS